MITNILKIIKYHVKNQEKNKNIYTYKLNFYCSKLKKNGINSQKLLNILQTAGALDDTMVNKIIELLKSTVPYDTNFNDLMSQINNLIDIIKRLRRPIPVT